MSRAGWLVALLALGLVCSPTAPGQDTERGRREQSGRDGKHRRGGQGRSERGPGGPHRHGGGMALGPPLFSLSPQDRGPLVEGEEEELLALVQQHLPRFHEALERLRSHNPQRFREKLAEHAPRLRQFRRVLRYSPRIAEIIQTYAETRFRIQRIMRALRQAHADSALRERGLQKLRSEIAKNVRQEIRVLEVLTESYEQHRNERIADRVAYLTAADADLIAEPTALRELVDALHAVSEGRPRDEIYRRIETAAARQVDREVEALRERVERMRGRAPEESDRRFERMVKSLEERGGRHRGRGPDQGRGRGGGGGR